MVAVCIRGSSQKMRMVDVRRGGQTVRATTVPGDHTAQDLYIVIAVMRLLVVGCRSTVLMLLEANNTYCRNSDVRAHSVWGVMLPQWYPIELPILGWCMERINQQSIHRNRSSVCVCFWSSWIIARVGVAHSTISLCRKCVDGYVVAEGLTCIRKSVLLIFKKLDGKIQHLKQGARFLMNLEVWTSRTSQF